MNTTLIKLSLAALVAASLSGCDFGGGGDDDQAAGSTRLYISNATDSGFGKDGFATPDLSAHLAAGDRVQSIQVNGLLADSQARVVAVGAAYTTTGRHLEYLARFTSTGQPDPTCAGVGVGVIGESSGFGGSEPVEVRAVAATGGYVVRGTARDRNFTAVNEDCTVGAAGQFWASDIADSRSKKAMTAFDVDATGTIVAANSEAVVRFTPDGKVDSTFGTAGLSAPSAAAGGIENVRLRDDGRVVLVFSTALDTGFAAPRRRHIAELDASGQLNASFGQGGIVSAAPSTDGTFGSAGSLVLLSDGSALLAWSTQQDGTERAQLFKVDARGTPSAGFGQGAAVTASYQGEHTSANWLSSDGRNVALCGAVNPYVIVAQHRIAAYAARVDAVSGTVDGWGAFNNPVRANSGWAGEGGVLAVEDDRTGRFHECRGVATVNSTTFVSLTGFRGIDFIARVTR